MDFGFFSVNHNDSEWACSYYGCSLISFKGFGWTEMKKYEFGFDDQKSCCWIPKKVSGGVVSIFSVKYADSEWFCSHSGYFLISF